MREFLTKIYHHAFYEYSAMKSKVRILVLLNKNENSNTKHEEIHDVMNDWFIDTVEQTSRMIDLARYIGL